MSRALELLNATHASHFTGALQLLKSSSRAPLCLCRSANALCPKAATLQACFPSTSPFPPSCHSSRVIASAVVLAAGGGKDLCLELIQAVSSERAVLVQACAARVDKTKAQQLIAAVGPSAAHVTLSDGEVVVAAQLCGASSLVQALKAAAERYGGEKGGIVIVDAAAAASASQLFFSQWREHSGHAVTK